PVISWGGPQVATVYLQSLVRPLLPACSLPAVQTVCGSPCQPAFYPSNPHMLAPACHPATAYLPSLTSQLYPTQLWSSTLLPGQPLPP
ncbi:hypothetical protein DSO57_1039332, partial [Entomophthora muscae]